MRKISIVIMALITLFISACFDESEVVIKNNSSAEAWVTVDGGTERFIHAQGSTRLSYSSPRTLLISYRGYHILPGNILLDMNIAGANHLSLEANCGALRVHNSSNLEIRDLRISPSGQNYWSGNLLQHPLNIGDFTFFSQNSGFYDLKIQDQHNNYFYVSAQRVEQDKTRNYIFTGMK